MQMNLIWNPAVTQGGKGTSHDENGAVLHGIVEEIKLTMLMAQEVEELSYNRKGMARG